MSTHKPTPPRSPTVRLHDYLSREEIAELLNTSNLRGWTAVLTTWGMITASFVLVAVRPGPVSVLIALAVIGSRHLALGILMHDATHGSLFRSAWLNRVIGRWLCAYPIFQAIDEFRRYHLRHHLNTGTEHDPDLPLARSFPISRDSFMRKLARDLLGITGVRFYLALFLMRAGLARYELNGTFVRGDMRGRRLHDVALTAARNLAAPFLLQGVMIGVLAMFGHPWLYLLWVGAMLTTAMLALRVRAISEHAVVPDPRHPLRNARTVEAPWWQRWFFAPHNVNYHLEHHLLMSAPHHNLPRMHQLLRQRGALEQSCIASGYGDLVRQVTYSKS